MSLRQLAFVLLPMAALAQPAAALTFNFTTVAGDTLSTAQAAAFQAAADVWSASLSDAITVNLQVGFSGALGANVLGATTPTLVSSSKAAIGALLAADAKGEADAQAVATYNTSTQTTVALTSAEAKALGALIGPGTATSDGRIEFSSSFTFSTARNADGSIAAGTYDLIGIAEHEIGHLLGFVSSIDGSAATQTVMDQFRYSAAGVRSVMAGAAAYFSIDKGVTDLANFAAGVVNGAGNQASHWLPGTSGVMVPEAAAGQVQNITQLDLRAMDALGYDLVAVPEPWSLSLLASGLVGAVTTRRRRRGC